MSSSNSQVASVMLTLAGLCCGCAPALSKPPCEEPLEVRGERSTKSPGVLVRTRDGADTSVIIARHRQAGLDGVKAFSNSFYVGEISSKGLAALRCDSDVTELAFGVFLADI